MSREKRLVRHRFRETVFQRDRSACVMCGGPAADAHHITDRTLMPNGGYVPQNGITLCEGCHLLAERYHATGTAAPGYAPEDLYRAIRNTYEAAHAASLALDP